MTSELEQYCAFLLKIAAPNITWEREYVFAPPRRYRFDFAAPSIKLAIECEGGTFSGGAHTRGFHFRSDCRKYNLAVVFGWRVLRFDREMLENGEALDTIKEAVNDHHGGASRDKDR